MKLFICTVCARSHTHHSSHNDHTGNPWWNRQWPPKGLTHSCSVPKSRQLPTWPSSLDSILTIMGPTCPTNVWTTQNNKCNASVIVISLKDSDCLWNLYHFAPYTCVVDVVVCWWAFMSIHQSDTKHWRSPRGNVRNAADVSVCVYVWWKEGDHKLLFTFFYFLPFSSVFVISWPCLVWNLCGFSDVSHRESQTYILPNG